MKKLAAFLSLFTIVTSVTFSQYKLEIEITSIKNNSGTIMLELYDSAQKVINQSMSEIKDQKCLIVFENLKPAKYAFRYFHDENKNGKLDTNTFGIPKEGYGFSNNAKGSFGPPPFEKWIFEIKGNLKVTMSPN